MTCSRTEDQTDMTGMYGAKEGREGKEVVAEGQLLPSWLSMKDGLCGLSQSQTAL